MAKVTGPLFSIDASGKFADSLVFSSWKGINYVRKYAKPGGKPSSRQKFIKSLFSAAVEKYKTLEGKDKEAWKLRAANTPMSGYNLFIRKVMNAFNEGFPEYNIISQMEMEMVPEGIEFSCRPSHPVSMEVKWGKKGSALNNSLHLDSESYQGEVLSFTITDLDPSAEYVLRLEQPEIYTRVPREISINADINQDETYEFMLGAKTADGKKLIDTTRVHKLSDAPDMSENDGKIEFEWDSEQGISEYHIYVLDRVEETAELIGITRDNTFTWKGEPALETLELEKGWQENEKSARTAYLTGESGDYQFSLL